MSLPEADRERVVAELDRDPTPAEAALFENLWSEHCAYRSSRPLLGAFDSEGESVVVGPGDDAAVLALDSDTYVTFGIESHNHPSYVDPYDGAATGVGGIVRDTLSMGAYPIALADSLYFGAFDADHSRYLFSGVVEGIADYGNAIGVPTVAGSTSFHPGYTGNPLVNVACVGLIEDPDRLVTAEAQRAGNRLVLVGNATGRDGLGGASFASEDLAEDAETEDRPAVQVGDPYTEKLLIEANEQLVEEGLIESARDLGAAGLGGASSELVAKGGLGARIDLDAVHQREPEMNPMEILLAESQERMCYEVIPENVARVEAIAERYDLGCSVIGRVTDDARYTCTFSEEGDTRECDARESDTDEDTSAELESVVDLPAEFLADGAPANDLAAETLPDPERDLPDTGGDDGLQSAFESVVADPNTADKRWVYRQYDHEVGLRTTVLPGDDAAVLAIPETASSAEDRGDSSASANWGEDDGDGNGEPPTGLALSAGAEPGWTDAAPRDGARAIVLENATNLAAKGATPLAAVDCLNGGNPESPDTYGGFSAIVDGLAGMCADLSVPVVGGNVSLYNDSTAGPIPPTPTLAMLGTRAGLDAPPMRLEGDGDSDDDGEDDGTLVLVGDRVLDGEPAGLGGSAYLANAGGTDRFPRLPEHPCEFVETLASVADHDATAAVHDASHGGLAVTLAEMISEDSGARVELARSGRESADDAASPAELLFHEQPGRAVIQTRDPEALRESFAGVAPIHQIGVVTETGTLDIHAAGEAVSVSAARIADLRDVLARELD